MTVAGDPRTTTEDAPRPAARPVRVPARHRAPVETPPHLRGPGRRSRIGRPLAAVFAVAWLLCPTVEPLPAHDVPYPLWQLPIDLGAVASIVLAVVALWRGSRHAPRLGIAAGVFMAVETITCPWAGHTPVGWWTWVQAGLSLLVLFTSTALVSRWPRLTADR